ncbi:MAG TPA: transglutaminase-like domain-containing protein [Bacteroidales bacterium]|nr:transglutaminase-like domain-containing protein [Bacteroidales bacterium]
MDKREILAMISLLDDNDHEVINTVTGTLLRQGAEVIPELEKAWEGTLNEKTQARLENLIQEIQFNRVKTDLGRWLKTGAEYVLEGAFYVARFQFPDITMSKMNGMIESIRKDVWLEINNNLTALEKVKILNYVIFDLHKFARNNADFYSPQNSYINQVFETRKGNPISLAIIYLSVAHKLSLPIYGVNLPKNFILAYKDEYRQHDAADESEDILFYINPYNKGAVLGRREIDYFISQQQIKSHPSFYIPCSNVDIIVRLINNLILSFEKLGYAQKIAKMKELLEILEVKE